MRFTSMLAKNQDTFQLILYFCMLSKLMVSEHILKFVPCSFSFSPNYHRHYPNTSAGAHQSAQWEVVGAKR